MGMRAAEPVVAAVTSALMLSDGQRMKLESVLTEKLGAPVVLALTVDPNMIGGLSVYVGGRLIDNTVKKQLQEMKTGILNSMAE